MSNNTNPYAPYNMANPPLPNYIDNVVNYMSKCRYNNSDNWIFNSFINQYSNESILINILLFDYFPYIVTNNYCDFNYLYNYLKENNHILLQGDINDLNYYQEYDVLYLSDNNNNKTVGMIYKFGYDNFYTFLTFNNKGIYRKSLNDYLSEYPEYIKYELVRPTKPYEEKKS